MRTALILLAIALVVPACDKGGEAPAPAPAPTPVAPAATAAAPANTAPATKAAGLEGTVTERLDAAQYSYLKLQTASGEVWAAVPQTDVANGTQVTVVEPMLMTKFESKALNRTFDEVYFGRLSTQTGGGMAAGAKMPGAAKANPHAGMDMGQGMDQGAVDDAMAAHGKPASPAVDVKVDKAPGGLDISEVWAQRTDLAGKSVTVRGKVVKYNANILGKNWLHIQDGSGDAAAATHDLTITTTDSATVGDVVTITGTVQLDQDFGAGYSYKTIVQDATVTK